MEDWKVVLASDLDKISCEGSYRKALAVQLQEIIDQSFAHILKNLDRNFGLDNVNNRDMRSIFLATMKIDDWMTDDPAYDVINDGTSQSFCAKFPFSHLIYKSIEQFPDLMLDR
jgi:hypothetical protein